MRLIDADALTPDTDYDDGDFWAFSKTQIENAPTIESEQRWIPCSERLPEEGQKCLVCDKRGIEIDTFIGHGNPYNWAWCVRDHDAWMPLPEPWKGEACLN